jgi:hypothetical protein
VHLRCLQRSKGQEPQKMRSHTRKSIYHCREDAEGALVDFRIFENHQVFLLHPVEQRNVLNKDKQTNQLVWTKWWAHGDWLSLQWVHSLQVCSLPWVLYMHGSILVHSQLKGFKLKIRGHKLRSDVNWQGSLKQKDVKWTQNKGYLYIFMLCFWC